MSFVRKAHTFEEQNLVITQENNAIYFTSTATILPKTELKVRMLYLVESVESQSHVIVESKVFKYIFFKLEIYQPINVKFVLYTYLVSS